MFLLETKEGVNLTLSLKAKKKAPLGVTSLGNKTIPSH